MHASLVCAQWPVTELTVLSRTAAQTGTELDVAVVAGNQLDEVNRMVFSHPSIQATLLTDDPKPFSTDRQPRYKQFHVAIPGDVPTGFYEVRVGGRQGLSNPRMMLISGLPAEVIDGGANQTAELPHLPLQTLVQGKTTASAIARYRTEIPQGATWRIDCLAQRIDSQLLPVLIVRDARGRELARSTGNDEQDPFCLLTPVDGEALTITVHDLLYRGGDEFFFQLVATPIDASNANATSLVQTIMDPPSNLGDGRVSSNALGYLAAGAIDPSVQMQTHDETQFKDTVAQPISMPLRVQGWFETRRDVDRFGLVGQPGQEWVFEILSDRLGSAADPVMRIERLEKQASGEVKRSTVVEQDDPPLLGDASFRVRVRDPMIRFNPPAPVSISLSCAILIMAHVVHESARMNSLCVK